MEEDVCYISSESEDESAVQKLEPLTQRILQNAKRCSPLSDHYDSFDDSLPSLDDPIPSFDDNPVYSNNHECIRKSVTSLDSLGHDDPIVLSDCENDVSSHLDDCDNSIKRIPCNPLRLSERNYVTEVLKAQISPSSNSLKSTISGTKGSRIPKTKRNGGKIVKETTEAKAEKKLKNKLQLAQRKRLRCEECCKYMSVSLCDSIRELDGLGLVKENIHSLGARVVFEMPPVTGLVRFRRHTRVQILDSYSASKRATLEKMVYVEEEALWLESPVALVLRASSISEDVLEFCGGGGGGRNAHSSKLNHIVSTVKLCFSARICVILYGRTSFLRDHKNLNRVELEAAAKRKRGSRVPSVAALKKTFESILSSLIVTHGVSLILCETIPCLASALQRMLKAVAEAPVKMVSDLKKEAGLMFGLPQASSAAKETALMGEEREGIEELVHRSWLAQLLLIPSLGKTQALAIASRYPSPAHLVKEYHNCSTVSEAEKLLCDLEVVHSGILQTSRRLGVELSRKIYLFLVKPEALAS